MILFEEFDSKRLNNVSIVACAGFEDRVLTSTGLLKDAPTNIRNAFIAILFFARGSFTPIFNIQR